MSIETPIKPRETIEGAVVRFAGDSGDGSQLVGTLFSTSSALMGNDLATLPDYPAEIRAPAGTLAGVSGFQIHFSSIEIFTPGDKLHALVAMNPAALRVNIGDLEKNGILIVNSDGFSESNLKMAGYDANPLEDGSLESRYRIYPAPITSMTREAVKELGFKLRDADRCKNFFALGLVYWLFDRVTESTEKWLEQKFAKKPELIKANKLAMRAGYYLGETAEHMQVRYHVSRARKQPGTYRKISGNEGLAYGLIAAAHQAGKPLFYGSYPITPASGVLHELSKHKNFNVQTFQAEDEISAMCSVLGAAYGGALAATGTSGPGLALKSESIGLAVSLELPCVIIDAQRAGPSTGLPTKTEQSDLLQAMFGRNGESPIPILAAQSPQDCFRAAFEAFQIAVKFMTPVILLSDGYIGEGSEPWRIPTAADLPKIEITHATDPKTFKPYSRNHNLARPWAIPGTPGLAHRIGGLEKEHETGVVSYDADNHERMCLLRRDKVDRIADFIPELEVLGPESGDLLLVSWGSCYGAARTAVERARAKDVSVAHAHLRHINPFPRNLGAILKRYKRIIVAEMNLGQLRMLIQSKYLVETIALNNVKGRPFYVAEVLEKIEQTVREG